MRRSFRSFVGLLLCLWAPLSVPLSAQPGAWTMAQIEACAKACGLREGQGCCCSKEGAMGAACPMQHGQDHGQGHDQTHNETHRGEPSTSHQPDAATKWEKHYNPCGGPEANLSLSRSSKQVAIHESVASFAFSLSFVLRVQDEDRSAGPRDDRLGLLPRPPPIFGR